jgi:hypothetical protein
MSVLRRLSKVWLSLALLSANFALSQSSASAQLAIETWGAKGDGRTDDTVSFNNAYAELTRKPHTTLALRPGAEYRVSCVHVLPYVRLQGNNATLTSTGNCHNAMLFTTNPGRGVYNPEVIIENLTLIGNPSVAQNCLDLQSVQVNGYVENVTTTRCGLAGININLANVYSIRKSSSFSNRVNAITISGSNDVTLDDVDAESGGDPTSTGPPIVVSGGYNFNADKIHCEIRTNSECIQINSNYNNDLRAIVAYYLVSLTSPGVVTLKSGTAHTHTDGIVAFAQAGTVTLEYLIHDFVSGRNLPGVTGTGFTLLAAQGTYNTDNSYIGGDLTVSGTSNIGSVNVNGVLGVRSIAQSSTGPPVATGCNGATVSSASTDQSGVIIAGNMAIGAKCTVSLTWASGVAYSNMSPVCFGYDIDHEALFLPAAGALPTKTTSVITGTATTGDRIMYTCGFGN